MRSPRCLWYQMSPELSMHLGHGWGLLFSLFLYSIRQMNGNIEMISGRKGTSDVPMEDGGSDRRIDQTVSS